VGKCSKIFPVLKKGKDKEMGSVSMEIGDAGLTGADLLLLLAAWLLNRPNKGLPLLDLCRALHRHEENSLLCTHNRLS
jgi:hypothetical protein